MFSNLDHALEREKNSTCFRVLGKNKFKALEVGDHMQSKMLEIKCSNEAKRRELARLIIAQILMLLLAVFLPTWVEVLTSDPFQQSLWYIAGGIIIALGMASALISWWDVNKFTISLEKHENEIWLEISRAMEKKRIKVSDIKTREPILDILDDTNTTDEKNKPGKKPLGILLTLHSGARIKIPFKILSLEDVEKFMTMLDETSHS